MPTRRNRCNVYASLGRYFPRMVGDIRLRYRQDARREHIPLPRRPCPLPQAKGETPTDQSSVFAGGPLMDGASSDNGSEQVARRFARVEPATDSRGRISDPCCTPLHRTGISLSGKAAWYNLVGR